MTADAADEYRPWEQPGSFRLDCEPHRGPLLLFLANMSLGVGLLSFFLLFPGVVGLPLAITTMLLAARDQKKMHAGCLDPQGLAQTKSAWNYAAAAVVLNVFGIIVMLLLVLALLAS